MKPIVFHPEAEVDLYTSMAYYEAQQRGLGGDLRREVEAAASRIREHPRSFPLHLESGTRKCLVRRFPYSVFFLELEDTIWIAAVAHQKRRPDYWSHRRPD